MKQLYWLNIADMLEALQEAYVYIDIGEKLCPKRRPLANLVATIMPILDLIIN